MIKNLKALAAAGHCLAGKGELAATALATFAARASCASLSGFAAIT